MKMSHFCLVVLLSITDNRRITILNTEQMVIIKKDWSLVFIYIKSECLYVTQVLVYMNKDNKFKEG